MYDNIIYQGKTLAEWIKYLHYMFTLGELYQMMLNGIDFNSLG